jgi:hypothetical protein
MPVPLDVAAAPPVPVLLDVEAPVLLEGAAPPVVPVEPLVVTDALADAAPPVAALAPLEPHAAAAAGGTSRSANVAP